MIDECGQILETLKGHAAELLQITDPDPKESILLHSLCQSRSLLWGINIGRQNGPFPK